MHHVMERDPRRYLGTHLGDTQNMIPKLAFFPISQVKGL
jgi:hypothetical protein